MNEILTQEKSIYLQIAEMIETDILRDILLEEERVPSTNELARLYVINPATAAKGVNILVDEGILYKKRGIGMFVAAGAKAAILKRRRNEFYHNYIKKLLEEAAKWYPGLHTVVCREGLRLCKLPEQVRVVTVPENVFKSISTVDTPQGAIFLCRLPERQQADLTAGTLLLDGIQDPGNLGTMLRSDMPISSPISLEIMMMDLPCFASSAMMQ